MPAPSARGPRPPPVRLRSTVERLDHPEGSRRGDSGAVVPSRFFLPAAPPGSGDGDGSGGGGGDDDDPEGGLLFVSGPSAQQIYRMNADGADVQRITNGEGEASNPSWSPDGQRIAFSWTRGYAKGDWNIFVMDVGSGQYTQLTHSEGKNENPVWAPDGRHLVFASTRGGRSQIYTMLADGSQVKQLTQQGTNRYPVWGVK